MRRKFHLIPCLCLLSQAIIFAVFCVPASVSGADRTAELRLHCLSIRIAPMYVNYFGTLYSLKIGSVIQDTGLTENGELTVRFNNQPTNSMGALYQLTTGNNVGLLAGDFYVSIPAIENPIGNDLNGFWNVDQGFDLTQTTGVFEDPHGNGGGVVLANWSHEEGSPRGRCEIQMASPKLGLTLDFNTTFELTEYSGALNYTVGSKFNHSIAQLKRRGNKLQTLTGGIDFKRIDPDHLDVTSFNLTNENGDDLQHTGSETIVRNGGQYTGLIHFVDGDPASVEGDYKLWHMTIRDNNDANGNGIPDFSEAIPNPRPPLLRVIRNDNGLQFELTADLATDVILEASPSLMPGTWNAFQSVSVTTTPQIVFGVRPVESAQFWRARLP